MEGRVVFDPSVYLWYLGDAAYFWPAEILNVEMFQAVQEHKHELPPILKMKEKSHKL